jgi:hypothetical protein
MAPSVVRGAALPIFNDLDRCVFALGALERAPVEVGFVRFNPREPHPRSAFIANRMIDQVWEWNKFRFGHRTHHRAQRDTVRL